MKNLGPLLGLLLVTTVLEAAAGKPFSEKQLAQQQRMKDCNAEARQNHLKGDQLRAFMKTCLSGGKVTVETAGSSAP